MRRTSFHSFRLGIELPPGPAASVVGLFLRLESYHFALNLRCKSYNLAVNFRCVVQAARMYQITGYQPPGGAPTMSKKLNTIMQRYQKIATAVATKTGDELLDALDAERDAINAIERSPATTAADVLAKLHVLQKLLGVEWCDGRAQRLLQKIGR